MSDEDMTFRLYKAEDWTAELAALKAMAQSYEHIDLEFSHSQGASRDALERIAHKLESCASAMASLMGRMEDKVRQTCDMAQEADETSARQFR